MAKDLKDAFPEMSDFSLRNIKYMRKFVQCGRIMKLCNGLRHNFHGELIVYCWIN